MCVSQDAEVVEVVEEPGEPAPPPKDPPGCWERFKVRSTDARLLLSSIMFSFTVLEITYVYCKHQDHMLCVCVCIYTTDNAFVSMLCLCIGKCYH